MDESYHEKHAECMSKDLVDAMMVLLKDKPREVVEEALEMICHKLGYSPPSHAPLSKGDEGETVYTDAKGHILKPPLNELGLAWCRSCNAWCKPVETAPLGRGI